MKIKTKLIALMLVACMSFLFAGCDLFARNSAAYLNQTVISISYNEGYNKGKEIEISRREYLVAYNNYGANLISNYNYSEEDAQKSTIDALVNRKVLLEEAKNNSEVVALVEEQEAELLYQTYEALVKNAREYEEQIKEDWGIKDASSMEEESSSGTVYTPYEKKAEIALVTGTDSNGGKTYEYRIKKVKTDSPYNHDVKFDNKTKVKEAFLKETKNNASSSVARESYVRYLASLKSAQKTLGTNYSNEKLLDEELDRIYNNLLENEYISQYEDVMQYNNGYSSITVAQMLRKYKAMMAISNFKYSNDADSFNDDMLNNFSNVNYFVNDDYFYVAHILIKFSDEEQKVYDNLEEQSNNGQGGLISLEYYETERQNLYDNLKATVTDIETGDVVSSHMVPAQDVLKEVQIALANAKTDKQKDEAFRELMYKYNEDGGIMNADYPYVIGENDSKMVENFTNASRGLNEAGEYGAISGLVQTEYGLHIIYYMGKCTNTFEFGVDGTLSLRSFYLREDVKDDNTLVTYPYSDIIPMYETKLNNLSNKTIFDLVYESLVEDNFSEYENIKINTLIDEYKIEVVTNI